jgi:anti-sigma B factor antagonist
MSPRFRTETADGTPRMAVVRVFGEVDPRSAPTLVQQCRRFAHEGRGLVLNLAGVEFLSSSGIGALLALVEEFRQTGHPFVIAECSPAADSVIRLLNLDQFLTLATTEREALNEARAA